MIHCENHKMYNLQMIVWTVTVADILSLFSILDVQEILWYPVIHIIESDICICNCSYVSVNCI